ncbi:MAG TPA: type II secretion system minor pseudopilin GspI [Steroidobacteraceae bacterium]|jgi:general secretion pathway protein I
MNAAMRGFTLIEVMVALVIVAFGMGAVLSALTSSANNVAAMHDRTLAQWIALNVVADTRLSLQAPTAGSTEGDVTSFGNANWHWQQDVAAVPMIPGMLEIVVRVRRTGTSSAKDKFSGFGSSSSSSGGLSTPGSSSVFSGSASLSGGSVFASSGGLAGFSSSSGGAADAVTRGMPKISGGAKDQNWTATVIGFRGDSVAVASGEAPDWTGTGLAGAPNSSSSSGGSSSGSILNPGTNPGASSPLGAGSGGAMPPSITSPGPTSGSSGGQ